MKRINLFEDVYVDVSETGEVYSMDKDYLRKDGRPDNRKGKKLKPALDKYGYHKVCLTRNGVRKNYLVHRLVATAYLPNPERKPTVNHKDGNKTNNNVTNLEWATQSEQKRHAIKTGLCDKNVAILRETNKKRAVAVEVSGVTYPSIREASRKTGIPQTTLWRYGRRV